MMSKDEMDIKSDMRINGIDLYNNVLAGQITRRVAPSVAPSTGCSIIILILFFRMNIVH